MTRRGTVEHERLRRDATRAENWKRWGTYLPERQWGTVREDYSADGSAWEYLPHDHARSRVYRWGEDGLLGLCDRQGRLCFGLTLWNGNDAILKERLFGLTNHEGNHGEDVKELYYYLDATPTASYARALYKYPQAAFPYQDLLDENRRRGYDRPEYDLLDTGIFDGNRYFDVTVEYAKASPEDILIRITVANRGPERARIHLLPTLWFRNTWAWGRDGESYWMRPSIEQLAPGVLRARHETLSPMRFVAEAAQAAGATASAKQAPPMLFTDNETNTLRLFASPLKHPWVKDAFHRFVVDGEEGAIRTDGRGTKAAAHYVLDVPAGGEVSVRLRLTAESVGDAKPVSTSPGEVGADFDAVLAARIADADAFYEATHPMGLTADEKAVSRQAYAGLLWTRQFYHYVVEQWLEGDPAQPKPPPERLRGRNREWRHHYGRDVLSVPDSWEYPWYAAWDLAFHMLPFARIDATFAKEQLILLLREWYMHPNGQLPAYEFALSDVNPPVHAWAAWRVYKITAARGQRDRHFLARVFQKLLINFTWWVNRKDEEGNNLFAGGFLGLDNIGVFDHSQPLPLGMRLTQADATAWMAFYASTMMTMAIELAQTDSTYEDLASKFFEHFIAIVDAMNSLGGTGLWDEQDGFYYDLLHQADRPAIPLRARSIVGIIPLFAVEVLETAVIDRLPGFKRRLEWFLENRKDLARHIAYFVPSHQSASSHRLLAVPSRERLERVLRYLLDETEFLAPNGIRGLSRVHRDAPYVLHAAGREHRVAYVAGESSSGAFGGNSNWRGPVWFPLNYLLVESLEKYHHFYGDTLQVECPVGSKRFLTLGEVATELSRRLCSLFLPGADGARPCHGGDRRYADDPHFRELLLFHEYFDGDDGRGVGAAHQTGWTSLVTRCLEEVAQERTGLCSVPPPSCEVETDSASVESTRPPAPARAEVTPR